MSESKHYSAGSMRLAHPNKGHSYKYFLPNNLPRELRLSDGPIGRLLEDATHSLGQLNSYARFVPDIDFFIRMHEAREATAMDALNCTVE